MATKKAKIINLTPWGSNTGGGGFRGHGNIFSLHLLITNPAVKLLISKIRVI